VYIVPLKTAVVEATRSVFDADYVEEDFRDLHVSIEFPVDQQEYPAIWVDWEPVGELTSAGINHKEILERDEDDGGDAIVRRWRFQGNVTFTIVAMTSLERDRLVDEMIRVLAFGDRHTSTMGFRQSIESNDFVGINFDFDEVAQRGFTASPGTPWGTDDLVYEGTVAVECVGEFVSDPQEGTLLRISKVIPTAYSDQEQDPTTSGGWI
jgi:hypothetical protein